jgi:hypothetical protein
MLKPPRGAPMTPNRIRLLIRCESESRGYCEVSGLPIRRDILARVVNWQLAKRRAGTHKT